MRVSIQIPSAPDLASWSEKARRRRRARLLLDLGAGPPRPVAAAVRPTRRARRCRRRDHSPAPRDNGARQRLSPSRDARQGDRDARRALRTAGSTWAWAPGGWRRTTRRPGSPPGTLPRHRVGRLFESIEVLEAALHRRAGHVRRRALHGDRFPVVPEADPDSGATHDRARRQAHADHGGAQQRRSSASSPHPARSGTASAGFEEQLSWIADARSGDRDDLMVGLRIPFGEVAAPGREDPSGGGAARRKHGPRRRRGARRRRSSSSVSSTTSPSTCRRFATRYGISYITLSEEIAWQVAPILEQIGS